jgi:hypothetical protein
MRKLSSIAGAALLAVTALATPASAQQMQATGSCGASAGNYGLTDVNSGMQSTDTQTVNALYYAVNYSGVPAPTTVGVIVRQSGELESQVGVASFTAENAGGMFEGALRANISPESQGGNGSVAKNHDNPGGANFDPGTNRARAGSKDGPPNGGVGPTGGASPISATLTPGEYVFYVYTGSRGDIYNVKDGTVARNAFIADENGYLGTFSCGVSTDQGSGPG